MIWYTKKNFSIFVAEIFIYIAWRSRKFSTFHKK